MQAIDKHAPLRKQTVRNFRAPWLDEELRDLMKLRDDLKNVALLSSFESDGQMYRRLRNYVTALKKKKKQLYYGNKIKDIKDDKKKLWSLVNGMMGRKPKSTSTYLEVEGNFD